MNNKDNIVIDFSKFPFCFRTIKIKGYTNKLENSNQFFKYFKNLIERDMPFFTKHNFDTINYASKQHSHSINSNTSEHSLIKEIVKKLCKDCYGYDEQDFELFYNNYINDYTVWQLGVLGGIRLIGVRNLNVFSVLFIDYHHLIYPDKKHNQPNHDKYDFCPMTN